MAGTEKLLSLDIYPGISLAQARAARDAVRTLLAAGQDPGEAKQPLLRPTCLMADVEVVATDELYNINRTKLESLIHHFFASVRLDMQVRDRVGNPVVPREWFLSPTLQSTKLSGR